MNVLCVCRGGRNRSRALATALKEMGHNSAYCGIGHVRALRECAKLAELVICVDYPDYLPEEVAEKTGCKPIVWSIGKDTWSKRKHTHPELISLAESFANTLNLDS